MPVVLVLPDNLGLLAPNRFKILGARKGRSDYSAVRPSQFEFRSVIADNAGLALRPNVLRRKAHFYGLFSKREYARRAPNRLDEPEYREWWQPIGKQVVGVLWIRIHIQNVRGTCFGR
jgi:hypothetical protein